MRKELIIAVAGSSERFSKSLGVKTLKCIYYENNPDESLLSRLICNNPGYDRYIVVGGYKYPELLEFVEENLFEYADRICMVENTHFKDYGSGYSLYLGLLESFKMNPSEVVFAEGDLFLDKNTLDLINESKKPVITFSRDPITAAKSVVIYMDMEKKIHYLYDTGHRGLFIPEEFTEVFNSGQVWKFTDTAVLEEICAGLKDSEKQGTNLVIIQKYFDDLSYDEYEKLYFNKWINCNTISDYKRAMEVEDAKDSDRKA